MNLSNKSLKLKIVIIFITCPIFLFSQPPKIKLDKSYNNIKWSEFEEKVSKKFKLQFYYDNDSLPNIQIYFTDTDSDLIEILNKSFKPYNYYPVIDNQGNIFITKNKAVQVNTPSSFYILNNKPRVNENVELKRKTDKFLKTDNMFAILHATIGGDNKTSGNKASISGHIKLTNDSSAVVNCVIEVKETGKKILTDGNGQYKLYLKTGDYSLILSSIESRKTLVKIKVLSDGKFDIFLEPKLIELNEIIVRTDSENPIKSTKIGYQKLETKKIKEIPVVLGERDVVKISQLLPGVQSVGEGSSGVNVRGSPTDQNLFLINDVPIYNTSHLFGFFSAFNSDALESFSLYKSSIPASFGGRLSSVFDIKTKSGNLNKFKATGGISPITARLLAEGPIKKSKSSYLVGVRSTYSDWLLKQVEDPEIRKSNAQFADVVTNFSFKLNKKNSINLFSYYSYDNIDIVNQNLYFYENLGSSLLWQHQFNQKNDLKTTLIYSQYNFKKENSEDEIYAYKDNFEIKHSEVKIDHTYKHNTNHIFKAGFNSILYQVNRGEFSPLNEKSIVVPVDLGKEQALESGAYLSYDWILSPQLMFNAGIRYNSFINLGPQNIPQFQENQPKSINTIIDTLEYSKNQFISYFGKPDIRLSGRYLVNDELSIKLGFSQLRQYIFMLSNTIAISPTDKWKLCNENIKPMSGRQYSIGLYKSFMYGKFDMSIESYYKSVDNIPEYKDGADLLVNQTPEIDILQGNLKMYGIELMLKKTYGKLNGWINYTYSNAQVTVDSENKVENINKGRPYPSNYDKPHAFNVVANYKLVRRFSISSNIVYSTGRPITYPIGIYSMYNRELPLYSERNEYRIPDYFRMDLSLKLEGNLAAKKLIHGTWILSVYNLTGRKNAYSIYYKTEEHGIKGYKLSIFGVPIVSLTYSFKLGNYAN